MHITKDPERGDGNTKGGPEEKTMMNTYNFSEFRSFTRARQIVGGVTLLLALTLAGPPSLWGQYCTPDYPGTGVAVNNVIVSPGSIFGGPNAILTATINLNAP